MKDRAGLCVSSGKMTPRSNRPWLDEFLLVPFILLLSFFLSFFLSSLAFSFQDEKCRYSRVKQHHTQRSLSGTLLLPGSLTSLMSLRARLILGQRLNEIPNKVMLNSRLILFRYVHTNIMMWGMPARFSYQWLWRLLSYTMGCYCGMHI